jgi:hypothetical protein
VTWELADGTNDDSNVAILYCEKEKEDDCDPEVGCHSVMECLT